ncbi:amidohydrolase [Polynucleobacter paneuropaeus]|jgi:hippurate hydrolase|uniref:amidohydrolase n=1 Tax=Polynucleobacter TaxID=44013 RepID=UPI001BFE0A93|nr:MULTISPECIES: amidohydrolase [Polynucleobacter]MBT8631384.1 amidohydrolase [Polynucleobacter paneuropaeus]MEA9569071.1 amidohydrolase [Polynucleobacter sp. AP-Nickl1-40-C4]
MHHHLVCRLCLISLFAFVATASAQTGAMNSAVVTQVDRTYPTLEVLYQDIHAHPEIAFDEKRTAAKLAAEMRALGFTVTEGVGKTGLVAIYENGAGPTIMVRTELDALPMEEKTGLPYASRAKAISNGNESFVAHSCGHDVHMASWVGTASTMVALKDQWRGRLMFVAQPAEETLQGAHAMVVDGLFTRFPKPDVALAIHTNGEVAFGRVQYRSGPAYSAADTFEITFKGRGGHGSAPHKTIDPIVIAAHFVTDVQTIVSREKDPREFGVITLGAFQAGTVANIIPDQAVVRGTLRSYTPEVGSLLRDGVRRMAIAAAAMSSAPEPHINIVEGVSSVINDEDVIQRVDAAIKSVLGPDQVDIARPQTPSEDFSVYAAQGVPSLTMSIGVYPPELIAAAAQPGGKKPASNHSPYFAPVPEPSIKTGVKVTTSALLTLMGKK